MVNNINKKNYLSINAEMLGRAYKVAKTDEPFMGAGGILIWSSGHGLNIMGTDRHSLIFFMTRMDILVMIFIIKPYFFVAVNL